jgi:hypothetical protein
MDADEAFFFRIGVNLRDLRASPDLVAAGRAVLSVVKSLPNLLVVRAGGAV